MLDRHVVKRIRDFRVQVVKLQKDILDTKRTHEPVGRIKSSGYADTFKVRGLV